MHHFGAGFGGLQCALQVRGLHLRLLGGLAGLRQFGLRPSSGGIGGLLIAHLFQFHRRLLHLRFLLQQQVLRLDHPFFKVRRTRICRFDGLLLRLHPTLLRGQRSFQILDAALRRHQLGGDFTRRSQIRLQPRNLLRGIVRTALRHLPVSGKPLLQIRKTRRSRSAVFGVFRSFGGSFGLRSLQRRAGFPAQSLQRRARFALQTLQFAPHHQPRDQHRQQDDGAGHRIKDRLRHNGPGHGKHGFF